MIRNCFSFLILISFTVSCSSWIKSTHDMIDREEGARTKGHPKEAPRDAYQNLVIQNKELQDKVRELEARLEEKNSSSDLASELVHDSNTKDKTDIISEVVDLSDIKPKKEIKAPKTEQALGLLEKEIALYQKASLLHENKKNDEAIKILNTLLHATNKQIQARSSNLLGEIYEGQELYDLAIQMYKDVIEKYSFSGVVIKSLTGIVNCYNKLGMSQEKIKYESLKELLGA